MQNTFSMQGLVSIMYFLKTLKMKKYFYHIVLYMQSNGLLVQYFKDFPNNSTDGYKGR